MKASIVAFAILLASACGDTPGAVDGSSDLSLVLDGAPNDLLSLPGCMALIACLKTCGSVDLNCRHACQAQTSANGQALYTASLNCVGSYCQNAGKCVVDPGTMQLVSPAGQLPGYCNDCLHDALAPLDGDNCNQPASADCMETQCASQFMQCLKDTP